MQQSAFLQLNYIRVTKFTIERNKEKGTTDGHQVVVILNAGPLNDVQPTLRILKVCAPLALQNYDIIPQEAERKCPPWNYSLY